jgi:hypothetical protein
MSEESGLFQVFEAECIKDFRSKGLIEPLYVLILLGFALLNELKLYII